MTLCEVCNTSINVLYICFLNSPVLRQTTTAPPEYFPVISVSVWICVVVVVSGSILVMLLFVIIYRWHVRHSLSTGKSKDIIMGLSWAMCSVVYVNLINTMDCCIVVVKQPGY